MSEENHNLENDADDANEEEQGDIPVVLQCSHCNVILGDSMSWVSTNSELKSITLRSVSSMVIKGKQLVTSTEGIDLGSTYQQLQCNSCEEVVGRVYTTTPRTLDDLRDLFTLYITKINSYQVGSSEQTPGIRNSLLDLPTLREIQTSITKTQVMVCALNERVLNIEKALESENEEETDPKLNNGADKVLQVSTGKRDGTTDKIRTVNGMGRVNGKNKILKELNHKEEESESEEEEKEVATNKSKRGKRVSKTERVSKRSRIK